MEICRAVQFLCRAVQFFCRAVGFFQSATSILQFFNFSILPRAGSTCGFPQKIGTDNQ